MSPKKVQEFMDLVKKTCTKWLDPLDQIISNKDICVVFIKRVTQKMSDILIEDVKSLCVRKELLKIFINCVQKWPKEIRSKTVQELPNMYLFKIVDSLSTYGDFDFQVTLIAIVFRMYGKSAILSKLPDLLPESEELSQRIKCGEPMGSRFKPWTIADVVN